VSAIDQMARVYRWACSEKRRTLEDLLRLVERLRLDMGRLNAPDAAGGAGQSAEERRQRLERSIAEIDASIERARAELASAEAELARVEQTRQERETAERTSHQRRGQRTASGRRN
jgi:chromosome segregation ATPase